MAGGGFGGLYAATYLARSFDLRPEDEVLLVDVDNYFTFTPLLPEVAAGTLGREHVAVPFRRLAERHGFRFLQAGVEGIDPGASRLHTTAGELAYDHCILALGSRTRFFGNEELRRRAYPMKSVRDALRLRDRILGLCEAAEAEGSAARRRELLTFVVAGGGPAGVETASEILHLLREVLPRYYPCAEEGRVVLADAGERILRQWDAGLAEEGSETLRGRGMEICLETLVDSVEPGEVGLSNGQAIASRTLVWTAGTAPHPLAAESGLPTEEGSAVVDRHLRSPAAENLYVVGDMSRARHPRTGDPYPPVAPVAVSQGVRAAGNVENARAGRDPEPYRGDHAGKLVSLGAGDALVEILGLRFSGLPAWLTYRATYLAKLVGLRNKVQAVLTLGLNRLFGRDLTTEWGPGDAGVGDGPDGGA